MITGLCLFGVGLGVLLLSGDDDDNDAAVLTPTPSRARTATSGATSEPSPEPTPTATVAPDADIAVRLLAWSRQQSRWLSDDFSGDAGSYREGESVPLLLRLEGAGDETLYEITVRYQCGTEKAASFDYLSGPAEADADSILTDPGPARARADSTIPVPDDPSITFDNGVVRRFQLWGATFQQSPQGPLPPAPCVDTKEFHVNVIAHAPAVYLVWAGHLASAGDWGEGRGASSQEIPLFSEVSVDGGTPARVEVAPNAVAP
jgi:hypothetical protein